MLRRFCPGPLIVIVREIAICSLSARVCWPAENKPAENEIESPELALATASLKDNTPSDPSVTSPRVVTVNDAACTSDETAGITIEDTTTVRMATSVLTTIPKPMWKFFLSE
jgi:hypothetical protein